jgi:predicted CoA-binding protein
MKQIIDQFIKDKNIALIGVSGDEKKFGNALMKELIKKGYSVYPVHPELKESGGIKCYPSLNDLPDQVHNLLLAVQPNVTEEIVSRINPRKIRRVWMQRSTGKGSASEKAILECRNKGIEVVYGFCPLMFFAPHGIHGLHFWMRKTFGKVPPEFVRN